VKGTWGSGCGVRASPEGGLSYRGTSLERKRTPLGSYRRPMPRALGRS